MAIAFMPMTRLASTSCHVSGTLEYQYKIDQRPFSRHNIPTLGNAHRFQWHLRANYLRILPLLTRCFTSYLWIYLNYLSVFTSEYCHLVVFAIILWYNFIHWNIITKKTYTQPNRIPTSLRHYYCFMFDSKMLSFCDRHTSRTKISDL